MAATAAKTQRTSAQGDQSRERILDATIEIASQRGYHGTSIARVSELSGLPASSIYWHFASKDDLIAAVIQRGFERWLGLAGQTEAQQTTRDPTAHLVASMREQGAALARNPEFLRLGLMLALEQHPAEPTARALFVKTRDLSRSFLAESLDGAIEAILGHRNRAFADRLAEIAMAAADGLFIAHQIDPDGVDLAADFQLLAEMIAARITGPVPQP